MFIFQLIKCTAAKYMCSKAVFRNVLENWCLIQVAIVSFWSTLQCEKELEEIIARTHFIMH